MLEDEMVGWYDQLDGHEFEQALGVGDGQGSHPTISFYIIPFSSCLQSFPASGSFPMRQFFASGGRTFGVSALASVFPMNIQD